MELVDRFEVYPTGKYEREKEPLLKRLKLILLFNPLTEWIDTTHLMRLHLHDSTLDEGKKEGTPESKRRIAKFVRDYEINMDDFEPSDINKFRNFEDFFVRNHKPGSRPINRPDDAYTAVCAADSRMVAYETVAESKRLWIKGRDSSIASLTMDTAIGKQFAGGAVASFRLSPQDYHRYHSPVAGRIKLFRGIPGDYYDVDPVALNSDVDILTRNKRQFVIIETENFGTFSSWRSARLVIHDKYREQGAAVKKGDELGIFQFGGSSIIVAFCEGRIEFDKDLLEMSKRRVQVAVEVGMSLGSAVPSSGRSFGRYGSGDSTPSAPPPPGELSYADVVQKAKDE
ncbi:phosphatidylserine decarboxylase-domain-containing protein [Podospora didyma]|uniref:Phosphatidylserine decarboxylase-domain-containing protein n=1 Tax=Podospora didyma TaxID=330526 RepID=A0AAE0K1L5_9PEZI|nr:phosphatidylserine decarboxylase-domain-containing protein [Podospora didyma]